MNLLFENLEKLIDAPNGIEKARELILQLAVQGKLTSEWRNSIFKRHPELVSGSKTSVQLDDGTIYEPASELLKKIKKEKEKLIAEGKIKKQNNFEPVDDDEKPFIIPNTWLWVRIGLLGEIFNGNSINKEEKSLRYSNLVEGYDYISTKDVDFSKRNLNYDNGIRIPLDEPNFKIAHRGSVLICSEGGSAGRKIGIVEKDICFGNKLFAIETYIDLEQIYIYSVYSSPYFFEQFSNKMTGIIGGISLNNFKSLLFPLPPLAEQKRIVEKVNSLIAQLDELKEKRERRNQKRIKLNNALLDKLLTSKDDKELKTNWKRIEENFSTLYSVPENVDKLKQAILQLAVQGKLVKQDPKDEPASEMIKQLKKEIEFENTLKNEYPFKLPSSWEWIRFRNIIYLKHGHQFRNYDFVPKGIPVIKITQCKSNGTLDLSKCDYVDRSREEEFEDFKIYKDDILMALTGGTLGKVTKVNKDYGIVLQNYRVGKFIPNEKYIDKDFTVVVIKSNLFQKLVSEKINAGAQPNIGKENIDNLSIPLPPLAEQKRIVEKVNELMSLCNTLEEKLTKKEAMAERLVGAVVNAETKKRDSYGS